MAPGGYGGGWSNVPQDPYRIVATRTGRGTGDMEYKTADGRRWVPLSYSGGYGGTGVEVGSVYKGRVNPTSRY